ncbi:DUF882 domain-containing protein [Peteryoungia desertarenae]|uniref:DUF882 domain-containing protein n=1 Tax=Peteryoungia desertarenae TaxID=1813451 RepID=UPI001FE692F9|nr:DUF882 domain-containing protein [Peteryoungia desertarenae]
MSAFAVFGGAGQAAAETRSLKIHFVHTGEKVNVVYKRNGRYDPKGLRQLNNVLRDWRRNEPTKMDPRLFDLLWEVYRQSGATSYITAVSGYRSPQTNNMLRSRSKGVAKESQHTKGTAIDFYIPGVPLKRLREIGMKLQAGGVGYYPRSGSPFVHMDVGGVRAWPRMSRSELSRLFPDGKTVHIPADGKPLPGYQQALAEYKQRLRSGNNPIMMADDQSPRRSTNLFAMLFGGGDEDEAEDLPMPEDRPATRQQAPAEPAPVVRASAPTMVATALPGVEGADAPVPQARPALQPADTSLAVALYSPARNAARDALSQVASGVPVPAQPATNEFADLQGMNIPVPTLLGPRGLPGDAEAADVMTASVDPSVGRAFIDDNLAVPVPSVRPTVADVLLSDAQARAEAEVDEVEQAILSPAAAEALELSNRDPASELAAPSLATPTARPAQAEPPPVQIASIPPRPAPAANHAYVKPQGQFGDMFDQPVAVEDGVEAGLPTKGGRPSALEAEQARLAMYGGTRLTKSMIAQWALSQERSDSVSKPVKAPRVVQRTLAQPAPGLAVGFSQAPSRVDPGRFGSP